MRLRHAVAAMLGLLLLPHTRPAHGADWRRPDPEGKYDWVLVKAASVRLDPATGRMRFTYAHLDGSRSGSLTPLGRSRVKAAFDCRTGQLFTYRDKQWRPGGRRDFAGPVRTFVCKR